MDNPVEIRIFDGELRFIQAFKELGLKYRKSTFFSEFHGTLFEVFPARGEGSQEKNRILRQLADPVDRQETKWFAPKPYKKPRKIKK